MSPIISTYFKRQKALSCRSHRTIKEGEHYNNSPNHIINPKILHPQHFQGCLHIAESGSRLGLSLPPGANVTLYLDPAERVWSWRRELFHCFYNQQGGVC